MDRDFDARWTCPTCAANNLDNFYWSAEPICSECGEQFLWEDILTGDVFQTLNNLLLLIDEK